MNQLIIVRVYLDVSFHLFMDKSKHDLHKSNDLVHDFFIVFGCHIVSPHIKIVQFRQVIFIYKEKPNNIVHGTNVLQYLEITKHLFVDFDFILLKGADLMDPIKKVIVLVFHFLMQWGFDYVLGLVEFKVKLLNEKIQSEANEVAYAHVD